MAAIPLMGLGTFGRTGSEGLDALRAAIDIGYRHIDTAQTYETEKNVGSAVAESGLPRSSFFITTKVTFTNFARERFRPSLEQSLEDLGLDRVDLTLLHWPSPRDEIPLEVYVDELAQAKANGLTRAIGVSNFTIPLLERTVELLGSGAIVTNQVELHPFLQNRRLSEWCGRHGIQMTAYVPLAKGKTAQDPTLSEIAGRHEAEPTQIALAWAMQQGIAVIPASSNATRLRSNFEAATIRLGGDDLRSIARLDRNERIIDPDFAPVWDTETTR